MQENIALVVHGNKKKDLLTLIVPIVVAVLGLAKVSSLSCWALVKSLKPQVPTGGQPASGMTADTNVIVFVCDC